MREKIVGLQRLEGILADAVTRCVSCLMKLAFISPELIERHLNGTQAFSLSAKQLTLDLDLPLIWIEQETCVLSAGHA